MESIARWNAQINVQADVEFADLAPVFGAKQIPADDCARAIEVEGQILVCDLVCA